MARVALLSNPKSTGNKSLLPRIREYCAANPDIFHYEVEHADQIGDVPYCGDHYDEAADLFVRGDVDAIMAAYADPEGRFYPRAHVETLLRWMRGFGRGTAVERLAFGRG